MADSHLARSPPQLSCEPSKKRDHKRKLLAEAGPVNGDARYDGMKRRRALMSRTCSCYRFLSLSALENPGDNAGDQFGTNTLLFPTSAGDEIGLHKNVAAHTRGDYESRGDPAPELPE